MAARKIAGNINPKEITGEGTTYQFSAPTVNTRGEVVQGNNRAAALKEMYSSSAYKEQQRKYIQYIIDNARSFGLTNEDIAKIKSMKNPVMVNEIDVSDHEAIRLGQLTARDLETGGKERIDPVKTANLLGNKMSNYASVLLSSPVEDMSLSELVEENGTKAVKWLNSNKVISDTAAASAFNEKGRLTTEAKMDLVNVLKQSFFNGGVSDLPTMFALMPAKAQKALLSTFMRDYDSPEGDRILPELQHAVEVWYNASLAVPDFAKASNYQEARRLIELYTKQRDMLSPVTPIDIYSNFAIEMACRLQGCKMKTLQVEMKEFFNLVQGKGEGDMFGGGTSGEKLTLHDAIKRVFDVDYKTIIRDNNGEKRSDTLVGDNNESQAGGRGEPRDGGNGEPIAQGEGSAQRGGGTKGDGQDRPIAKENGTEEGEQPKQEEKKQAKSKWVDDEDAERFEELRRRLRKKLGGQLNMGLDPEAFTIGVEMSYLMLKHGARKFARLPSR